MKIYSVVSQCKNYRIGSHLYANFEDAQKRFDSLVNYYEKLYKTPSKVWENVFTNEIEVRIIDKATVYLICQDIH